MYQVCCHSFVLFLRDFYVLFVFCISYLTLHFEHVFLNIRGLFVYFHGIQVIHTDMQTSSYKESLAPSLPYDNFVSFLQIATTLKCYHKCALLYKIIILYFMLIELFRTDR